MSESCAVGAACFGGNPLIGQTLSNRYELRQVLGHGGMAVVYLGHDPWLDRDVAIKLLSTDKLSESVVARFQREARLAAGLDHPAIVPIYDFGRQDNYLFFVMPVLRGQTLADHLRAGSLELHDMLELAAQVAEGLAYSAAHGVVHRDIKPSNLMVSQRTDAVAQDQLRIWIMDFGLALASTGTRITRTGNLPGTLAYLSPEQVVSKEIDGRADLYALATVLYEYLAGGRPFTGPPAAVLYRIVHDSPDPLTWQGVDASLADLVHRCLAKEPSERPSGEELAARLRFLQGDLGGSGPSRNKSDPAVGPADNAVPLVGRDAALRRLEEGFKGSLDKGCQLWLVSGEAGIGKSRLLSEAEDLVRQRGFSVLRGRGSDRQDAVPYQAFCDLLEEALRLAVKEPGSASSNAPVEATELFEELVPELLSYFPSLRDISSLAAYASQWPAEDGSSETPAWVDDEVEDGRLAIFECVAKVFSRLAGRMPLMLSLEDLHLTDLSIDMLRYVARRLSSASVFIVGTFRPEELARRHPLRDLCRGLEEDPRGGVIALDSLGEAEHRLLAAYFLDGTPIDDALTEHLYATSEGNPLFLRELLRMLQDRDGLVANERGELGLEGDPWRDGGILPDTLHHLVEARLEGLGDEERDLLSVASVIGRHFEFDDLVRLLGDPDRADDAVERLLHRGVLEEDLRARGDVLRFASSILRDALYGALPRRRRRTLHRRYALALEERTRQRSESPGLALMHHFSCADMADKAVQYALLQARQSSKARSWDEVVRVTDLALQFFEDGLDIEELGELVRVEGELRWLQAVALRATGRLSQGLLQAEAAVPSVQRHGTPQQVAELALLTAEIAWQLRRVDKVQRWVQAGLSALHDSAAPDLRRKLLVLGATVFNLQGDYASGEALMAQVRALPQRSEEVTGRRGGTLVTALPNPVTTLDPGRFVTVEDIEVLANVFETLLQPDFEGHLLPGLAHTWRGEDDDQRFRFFLDEQARFSDGTPLKANDVKLSLERLAGRSAYGCSRTAFAAIRGIEALLDGQTNLLDGVEVVGEHELLIHLDQSLPIFPVLLCGLGMAVVRTREDGTQVGTGPFRLQEEQEEGAIHLERNPHHRDEGPFLDRLIFRTDLDAAAIAQALERGELDLARDLLPEDLDRLLRDARFRSQMVEANLRNIYLMMWNVNAPAAQHASLRRALGRVLKVDELIWRTAGRFARPASSLVPPGILGHMDQRPASLSLEGARELLAQVPGDRPLRLKVSAHPIFRQRYRAFLEAVFDTWRQVGIQVDLEAWSVSGFLSRWQQPDEVDLVIGRWLPEYDDPDGYMHLLLHSEMGFLHAFLASDELDVALQDARRERRPDRREAIYHQIEGTLRQQDLLLPLFHDVSYRIAHPRVRGLRLLRHPPYVDYRRLRRAGPSSQGSDRSVRRRSLRLPLTGSVPTLDPLRAGLADVAEVVPNIFETLTRVGTGATVVPHLAERVVEEDGGRRFRIHLPVNARFHDGRRLTSEDVAYSLRRLLGSSHGLASSHLLPLRGLTAFREGKTLSLAGLRLLSDHELVLELEQPMVYFPALLALPTAGIVAAGSKDFRGDWRSGTVGTGPFRVHRFEAGQSIELRAFHGYRRSGYPKCDGLRFELGVSSEQIAQKFSSGELAIAGQLRPADVRQLLQNPDLGYFEVPGMSTYFLVANVQRGPLRDESVRQQLRATLQVEEAVQALGHLGSRAQGLFPPGLLAMGSPSMPRESSSAEGTASSQSLAGMVLKVGLNSVYSNQHEPVWRALASQLEAAGVVLEIVAKETWEMIEAMRRGELDLVAARWLGDYPDADCFASALHRQARLHGMLCGDGELDRRIEEARTETDQSIRHALYRQMDRYCCERALLIPLFHEPVYRFAQPHVRGLRLLFGAPEVAYDELSGPS